MVIISFTAELLGNKEVTLNGVHLDRGEPFIEEKVIFNQLTLNQQWQLLSMARKLLNQMESTYQKSRVKAGELTHDDYDLTQARIRSGARGVPGTNLPPL